MMKSEKSNIEPTSFEDWEEKNRIRSSERYHSMVQQNAQIKKAESLLAHLGRLWGFNTPIPATEFEKLNFPYLVSTGVTTKHGNYAFVVGQYAYSFYDNQTFKIFQND
jgi:hypothetical protein